MRLAFEAELREPLEPGEPLAPPEPLEPQGSVVRLTSPDIRLQQVKDEIVAWVKTLFSAAIYAVLIVTFVLSLWDLRINSAATRADIRCRP